MALNLDIKQGLQYVLIVLACLIPEYFTFLLNYRKREHIENTYIGHN